MPNRSNNRLAHPLWIDCADKKILTTNDSALPLGVSHPSALLTVREVAALLRVPISWVYDHVRPGCSDPLPVIKIGKYLRFRSSDIVAYVDALATSGRHR